MAYHPEISRVETMNPGNWSVSGIHALITSLL